MKYRKQQKRFFAVLLLNSFVLASFHSSKPLLSRAFEISNFYAKVFLEIVRGRSQVCSNIIQGSIPFEYKREPDYTSDEDILRIARNGCRRLLEHYAFNTDNSCVCKEEKDYPVSFSILMHTKTHQFIKLLSAIYRPHNVYCVHVDLKSPASTYSSVTRIAKCLRNVYLSTKREDVVYASYSRLQADLNCMADLLNKPVQWKHLINLSGQDFPIRTNYEIVQELKLLGNRNLIVGDVNPSEMDRSRTRFVHRIVNTTGPDGKIETVLSMFPQERKKPPPHSIALRKNSAYNIYSRNFLRWVLLESKKARDLLSWSRDTRSPDEHFWLMMNALEEAPGRSEDKTAKALTPFVKWNITDAACSGYWRHFSCVFGIEEVREILNQGMLFANKFDITYDKKPLQCIRDWLREREFKQRRKCNPHYLCCY